MLTMKIILRTFVSLAAYVLLCFKELHQKHQLNDTKFWQRGGITKDSNDWNWLGRDMNEMRNIIQFCSRLRRRRGKRWGIVSSFHSIAMFTGHCVMVWGVIDYGSRLCLVIIFGNIGKSIFNARHHVAPLLQWSGMLCSCALEILLNEVQVIWDTWQWKGGIPIHAATT